jgi:hypothetical protein
MWSVRGEGCGEWSKECVEGSECAGCAETCVSVWGGECIGCVWRGSCVVCRVCGWECRVSVDGSVGCVEGCVEGSVGCVGCVR